MFDPVYFVEEAEKQVRELARGKTIIAASGGVDSTVIAAIAHRAIPERLHLVFVDTGYMRKGEADYVRDMFASIGAECHVVDCGDRFFKRLEGVVEPERKRKIIGEEFIRVFEEEATRVEAEFLVQGTIAPDWIESGGGIRDTIKSHHNVGGLPEKFGLKLIEPLREIYKDEVRKVARYLELPVSERQPFPGPGLAVRIMGEPTPEATEIIREACWIVEEELEGAAEKGLMELPWQYFAVLTPVKTVGVQGDIRAYGYTIAVRAVESVDGMSAAYSKVPHEVLERISVRITNAMPSKVNRICYDITHKPPGTIEWE
jgi:GMP synthase (glutamine-hydrolysing)